MSIIGTFVEEPEKQLTDEEEKSYLWFNGNAHVDCGKFQGCCQQFDNGMTVEASIKITKLPIDTTAPTGHIVNCGGGWEDNGFSLFIFENHLRVEMQNKQYNTKVIVDNDPPPVCKWVHVAFTWLRSTGEITTYINYKIQSNKGSFTQPLCLEGSPNIAIGTNLHHQYPFTGYIHNVRIWTCALTRENLLLYSTLSPQTRPPHLVALWPLDTGVGDIAECVVDPMLTGKIHNATWKNKEVYQVAPVVIPPVPAVCTWAGRICEFLDVDFNGTKKNAIVVFPDQEVTLSLKFNAHWSYSPNDYCPGCVVQLYYGMCHFWSVGIVEHGVHSHIGKSKHTFAAPLVPGVYYVTMNISLMYNYVKVTHPNSSQNALAVVRVIEPQWSLENHKYFPAMIRRQIKIVLMMACVDGAGKPLHPETFFYTLPKDVLFKIFDCLW